MTKHKAEAADSILRIGVSSCLVGQKVRYDGDSRAHRFITDTLAGLCEIVPVCPEVGIGMGVPRPPIHLRGMPGALSAVGVNNPDLDVTSALKDYARITVRSLPAIAGYLFKSRSPSCALGSAKVALEPGEEFVDCHGIYAQGIVQAMPLLPVAEETCLDNPECRDHFFERVFIYHRWLVLRQAGVTPESLQDFHNRHEFTIRSRSEQAWHRLADLLLKYEQNSLAETLEMYITRFMQILKAPVTLRQHVNMQQLAVDYLKTVLPGPAQAALIKDIDGFACGDVNRTVPANSIRRLLARRPHQLLQNQVYLYPSALEAELRY